jgi:hypothetical protein
MKTKSYVRVGLKVERQEDPFYRYWIPLCTRCLDERSNSLSFYSFFIYLYCHSIRWWKNKHSLVNSINQNFRERSLKRREAILWLWLWLWLYFSCYLKWNEEYPMAVGYNNYFIFKGLLLKIKWLYFTSHIMQV